MKRKPFIIIAVALLFLAMSLANFFMNITSDRLLISKLSDVNMAQIDLKRESSFRTLNKGTIKDISDHFAGIKMKKIEPEKELELMKSDKLLWTITFNSNEELLGVAMVFATGEILIADVKTMQGNKRTQMFIGNVKKKKLEELNTLLKKQSNMLENIYQGG